MTDPATLLRRAALLAASAVLAAAVGQRTMARVWRLRAGSRESVTHGRIAVQADRSTGERDDPGA
ncbi:hypothetical protein [Cellulomonas fimi]|uniref:Uncharacterized protein n=1 Tax=Cellulomonas fimi TaxID=1708 RepID=A0A7Y0LZC2_CELFI|nr:hypothetical protein [Cellulomonas fimi]NMR20948.1 hypothetical protein [Cellulomonas fimi]